MKINLPEHVIAAEAERKLARIADATPDTGIIAEPLRDGDGNIMPAGWWAMTEDEYDAAVAAAKRAAEDIAETEPTTDTCPLHGAKCPAWATLGADK